jgi:hypothetical protein
VPQEPGNQDAFRALRAMEHGAVPFLWFEDGSRSHVVMPLKAGKDRFLIGRGESCDIRIDWDERVSRSHAELVSLGDDWTIVDDGLSANGTSVNGERVAGRRRLADRDVIRVGQTVLLFRRPISEAVPPTVVPQGGFPLAPLTESQRRVLACLARPCATAGGFASPSPNEQIASELHLSVDAVKGHLRTLFGKFAIGDLPQNKKRMRLVQLALEAGVIDDLIQTR